MQRREFVMLLGAAAAWPLAANAEQREGMRRIGMLTGIAGEDVQTKARIAAFLQELQKLGWTEGRDFRMDIRAGAGNLATIRAPGVTQVAGGLVSYGPDLVSQFQQAASYVDRIPLQNPKLSRYDTFRV